MKAIANINQGAIQETLARVALLVALLGCLSGCGAQTTARNSPSNGYNGPTYIGTLPTNPTSQAAAECNMFDSRDVRLAGKVTTYYWNGVLQEDKLRLRFTGLDTKFDTTSTVYIQFFRWKADTSGKTDLDQTPLSFTVYNGSSGSQALSNSMTSLSLADVAKMRTSVGSSGTTENFFNNVTIVLNATDYNWNALKVVMYDGATVLGQADLLLPVFLANPNAYASTHHTTLNQLHPFWSQRTQSASESDWYNRAMSYCF